MLTRDEEKTLLDLARSMAHGEKLNLEDVARAIAGKVLELVSARHVKLTPADWDVLLQQYGDVQFIISGTKETSVRGIHRDFIALGARAALLEHEAQRNGSLSLEVLTLRSDVERLRSEAEQLREEVSTYAKVGMETAQILDSERHGEGLVAGAKRVVAERDSAVAELRSLKATDKVAKDEAEIRRLLDIGDNGTPSSDRHASAALARLVASAQRTESAEKELARVDEEAARLREEVRQLQETFSKMQQVAEERGQQISALEQERDDAKDWVKAEQTRNRELVTRAQAAESKVEALRNSEIELTTQFAAARSALEAGHHVLTEAGVPANSPSATVIRYQAPIAERIRYLLGKHSEGSIQLRDYLAAHALARCSPEWGSVTVAARAYEVADAMLAVRAKK